uniref:Ricin B-type lectin domain-containing protein n=1 Tax=Steinernema glaseri TaxID=37863 RepID=A0A1I8AJS0_9BILA
MDPSIFCLIQRGHSVKSSRRDGVMGKPIIGSDHIHAPLQLHIFSDGDIECSMNSRGYSRIFLSSVNWFLRFLDPPKVAGINQCRGAKWSAETHLLLAAKNVQRRKNWMFERYQRGGTVVAGNFFRNNGGTLS